MGKTLIMISMITFLIITVVKSSLALSLGLVGALSIIRFRTPVKEPFELSYLFMSIAIGLGYGANQWLPTSIVIIFSLLVLIFYSKNSNKLVDGSYFIYMDFEKSENDMDIEDILKSRQAWDKRKKKAKLIIVRSRRSLSSSADTGILICTEVSRLIVMLGYD